MGNRAEFVSKRPEIAEICQRYGVQELLLFESGLGPEYHDDSDLDLLVEFKPGLKIGLIRFGSLQREFESLLGRKVDLVPKRGLKPLIRDSVLQHAEPVYAG